MTSFDIHRTSSEDSNDRTESLPTESAKARPWSPAEFSRWADAVASGEVSFPQAVDGQQRETRLVEIQRRRRARLVRFIACAIAHDISRSQPH